MLLLKRIFSLIITLFTFHAPAMAEQLRANPPYLGLFVAVPYSGGTLLMNYSKSGYKLRVVGSSAVLSTGKHNVRGITLQNEQWHLPSLSLFDESSAIFELSRMSNFNDKKLAEAIELSYANSCTWQLASGNREDIFDTFFFFPDKRKLQIQSLRLSFDYSDLNGKPAIKSRPDLTEHRPVDRCLVLGESPLSLQPRKTLSQAQISQLFADEWLCNIPCQMNLQEATKRAAYIIKLTKQTLGTHPLVNDIETVSLPIEGDPIFLSDCDSLEKFE